ncbi:murein transglycosylase A [Roseibium marinum]|nr:MltA domain-containing protein [Roseibium marinum]
MQPGPQLPEQFQQISFAGLAGWDQDDHSAALASFLRFCDPSDALSEGPQALRLQPDELARLCSAAQTGNDGSAAARRFFESRFTPFRITEPGFVTGYYEPEVAASRRKSEVFSVPLHKKPAGLEILMPENRPENWPAHLSHGRRTGQTLSELPDRGAIMDGALDGEELELAWLADPVDAYFIHVQGSARLRMTDGSVMRVGYAGKTGHPYTGIGRLLVTRGEGTPEDFTMAGLRAWLANHPDRRDDLFRENRSYIFFREVTETGPDEGPVGAAGLPLTPGRSLAIDPQHLPYGALVFVAAGFEDPDRAGKTFARLVVADDTGSAIKGRARGDIFTGSGETAGQIAGAIRHKAEFTVLVPNSRLSGNAAATD